MSEKPVASVSFEDTSTNPPTRGGFYIRPNQTVRIGRDTDRDNNDVVFADATVSRNHFELYSITVDEEGRHTSLVFVRDRQSSNGTLLNKKCVGKKPDITPGRLLQTGDSISIHPYITFKFYQLDEGNSFPCLTARQREELKLLEDRYLVTDRTLGDGAHAAVYLATDVLTGQQLACKVHNLDRRPRSHQILRRIRQEAMLLSYLDHPNILSIKAAFESAHSVYIFTELATGGDLFSLLSRERTLPELEIRWIIRQILNAVDYIHKKGVAHRDIKPENILCAIAPNVSYRLVLSDFGDSAVTNRGRLKSEVGTTFYRAPECYNSEQGHSMSVDIWSIGMLCLQLFSGFQELPNLRHLNFTSQGRIDSYLNIIFGDRSCDAAVQDGDTDYDDDDEPIDPQTSRLRPDGDFSSDAKDFIRGCLTYNSRRRLTAHQALTHRWMCESEEDDCLFRRLEHDNAASWEPKKIRLGPFIEKLGRATDAHDCDEQEPSMTAGLVEEEDDDEDVGTKISPQFSRKPTPSPASYPSSSHQQRGDGATGYPLSSNGPSSPPLTIRNRKRQPGLWVDSEPSPPSEEEEGGEYGVITANRPPLPSFTFTPPSPGLPELSSSPLLPPSQGSIILGESNSNEHVDRRSMEDASVTEICPRWQPPTTASTLAHLREAEKRRNDFKSTECKRRKTCSV
ncbi:serine/threonine protein kinase [Pseudoneurospora amorphoporcata]|uniref:Serine/threonine protein kinase n=1 Tax=Pseudoneurospora amorphoporcata TaxID=241081 RepID=A0AAN6NS08_9PEZI|nr:serine/threonine protein kinase [Pseudoneurospora amorphoporcata]